MNSKLEPHKRIPHPTTAGEHPPENTNGNQKGRLDVKTRYEKTVREAEKMLDIR